MDSFIIAPSKTHHHLPPADTSFPTVYPDPPVYQHATKVGHTTLWVVFALMLIATLSFAVLSWSVPAAKRLHHSLTTLIVLIGTLSYFALANGSGMVEHHRRIPEHHIHPLPPTHRHVYRDIYYARYIDWLLTSPLIILNLSVLAGLSGANIFSAVVANTISILTAYFAAVSHHKGEKWGWYTFSIIGFLWVVYSLLGAGIHAARTKKTATVSKFYTSIAIYTVVVALAYPIIWAISTKRKISVDGEIIAFAIIDVLAKGVCGGWLLLTNRRLPETQSEVGGWWAYGFNSEGQIRIGEDDEA